MIVNARALTAAEAAELDAKQRDKQKKKDSETAKQREQQEEDSEASLPPDPFASPLIADVRRGGERLVAAETADSTVNEGDDDRDGEQGQVITIVGVGAGVGGGDLKIPFYRCRLE